MAVSTTRSIGTARSTLSPRPGVSSLSVTAVTSLMGGFGIRAAGEHDVVRVRGVTDKDARDSRLLPIKREQA
jgi:hypothetical protein